MGTPTASRGLAENPATRRTEITLAAVPTHPGRNSFKRNAPGATRQRMLSPWPERRRPARKQIEIGPRGARRGRKHSLPARVGRRTGKEYFQIGHVRRGTGKEYFQIGSCGSRSGKDRLQTARSGVPPAQFHFQIEPRGVRSKRFRSRIGTRAGHLARKPIVAHPRNFNKFLHENLSLATSRACLKLRRQN
jgi:hypothetical protein